MRRARDPAQRPADRPRRPGPSRQPRQLCRKCTIAYNGVLQDTAARLATPLRRVGPKGEGAFEPVAWDAALAEIAERFRAVIAEHGRRDDRNVHYTGTCALLGYGYPLRLVRRLGATEVEADTVCNLAGHAALDTCTAASVTGFDPRTARDARCIVVWGANPSATAPHAHDHWLPEAPGSVVVVDPVATPDGAPADLHLQPFPGTDAALAFAWLHVLRRDGPARPRVPRRPHAGWDELDAQLEPCTPAWGEQSPVSRPP